jgi:beta-glucanase (GH16 family)
MTSLDPKVWTISTWTSPGRNATHIGTWSAKNVSFGDRGLCLALNQTRLSDGTFTSTGAEVVSNGFMGYGTYEWEMMASKDVSGTPVSGSITGLFIYRDQATTEIDFEMEGNERHRLTQCTSWVHESQPNEQSKITPPADADLATSTFSHSRLPHQRFFKYRFVWSPGRIEYYRDGVLIATHTKVVPALEAQVMMNHWGTNDPNWGGKATPDVIRFMYIKSFSFAPI